MRLESRVLDDLIELFERIRMQRRHLRRPLPHGKSQNPTTWRSLFFFAVHRHIDDWLHEHQSWPLYLLSGPFPRKHGYSWSEWTINLIEA